MQMVSDRKLKALVVSMDKHIMGSMALYLESKGHEVMAVTTFKAALEYLGQHNLNMIFSVQGRSTTEALDFFEATKKLWTASHAYRIILCDPCAPDNACDGLDQYADLCIQRPLNKKVIDQALLHANRLLGKTA